MTSLEHCALLLSIQRGHEAAASVGISLLTAFKRLRTAEMEVTENNSSSELFLNFSESAGLTLNKSQFNNNIPDIGTYA